VGASVTLKLQNSSSEACRDALLSDIISCAHLNLLDLIPASVYLLATLSILVFYRVLEWAYPRVVIMPLPFPTCQRRSWDVRLLLLP
jgi:hypothetical protein